MTALSSMTISNDHLKRRLRVAQGLEAGDLLLTGAQVVNVFTQRVTPSNVIIADGWIAGVGPYNWQAKQTIALSGKFIMPGLIDPHAHLESTLLTPAELARLIVPHHYGIWDVTTRGSTLLPPDKWVNGRKDSIWADSGSVRLTADFVRQQNNRVLCFGEHVAFEKPIARGI